MVKFSVEVAEFKENTVSAYEVLGKGGQAMFAEIDALAHNIHMPAQEAHALAQDLLTRGMEDDKMIAATIGAISAAKRGGPAGTTRRGMSEGGAGRKSGIPTEPGEVKMVKQRRVT